jgi:hypothetical protein
MEISPISAASLGQSVLASSNTTHLQQILQTLKNSIGSGNLNDAQSAFQDLQQLSENLATAGNSSSSSDSQLSADLAVLGGALSSGDLSTAQSAFATVQSDLKSSASPAISLEASAASQAQQLVQALLSPLNPAESSSNGSNLNSLLTGVYANKGLNVLG